MITEYRSIEQDYFYRITCITVLPSEILCPQRSAIVDGEISPASCLEHKQSLGVECHMTCRPGYSLDGIEEDTVTCQENSQWTNKDATPYCKGTKIVMADK